MRNLSIDAKSIWNLSQFRKYIEAPNFQRVIPASAGIAFQQRAFQQRALQQRSFQQRALQQHAIQQREALVIQ